MRYAKTLMILFLAVTLVGGIVFTANEVMAKVGDNVQAVCSVCHTMHHSQDGGDPNSIDYTGLGAAGSTGPNPALLYANNSDNNNTCVACHSGSTDTIVNGYDPITGAPQVDLGAADPNDMLAGGTYIYGDNGDDEYAHNVLGICTADQIITYNADDVPPGGSNADIGNASQITCAGTTGCHGERDIEDNVKAVHGAHHTNDPTLLGGSTIGNAFRFLSTDTQGENFVASGVKGGEETHWESGKKNDRSDQMADADAAEHNVYVAADINLVCASCHGNFHGEGDGGALDGQDGDGTGPTDPWLRHPTDVSLEEASDSGPSDEYKDYPGNEGVNYSLEAPVGYTANEVATSNVAHKTDGDVLCISCHRAHGSEYPDILRWCYSDMKATGGAGSVNTGCNACHTTK